MAKLCLRRLERVATGVTGEGCLARPCAIGSRNSNLYWDWFFGRAHGPFLGQDILNGSDVRIASTGGSKNFLISAITPSSSAPWCSRLLFFTKACHWVLFCGSSENSCVRASGTTGGISVCRLWNVASMAK